MSNFPIFRQALSDAFDHLLEAAKSLLQGCQELTGGRITTQELNKRLAELVHRVEAAITISERNIMASQAEAVAELKAIKDQNKKSQAEVRAALDALLAKITALEAAVANAEATPELTAAVAELKTESQTLDDLIPDAP
jgi:DNA repair exonuclease SbcCD ATPase subunit